jgi:hypothetical protein
MCSKLDAGNVRSPRQAVADRAIRLRQHAHRAGALLSGERALDDSIKKARFTRRFSEG